MENIIPKIKVTQLPSNFLPYPEGTVIYYSPFSFNELEHWAVIKNSTDNDKIQLGLKGIYCEGIEPEELDYSDYLFIQTLRKISTFDENKFKVPYTCPNCSSRVEAVESLENLEFSDLEVPELPLWVELETGEKLEFSTIRLKDILEANQIPDLESSLSTRLALRVKNMNLIDAKNLIGSIVSGDDMDLMAKIDDLLDFGNVKTELCCPQCKQKATITVKGVSALAEPFRKSTDAIKNRIVFGSPSNS